MDSADRFPSASALLARLPARVAHDLNNLIAVVSGHLYLARESPGNVSEDLDAMAAAVAKLESLSKNLAALGAIGGPERKPLSVNDLAREAASRHAGVALDLAEPVPAVSGNADDLAAALDCLVSNALEAAPGGPVRISTRAEGGGVLLAVEDSGPGIAPGIGDRVFDPLFSTRKGRGAGMGLFLVAAVANAHGTSCRLDPAPGGGIRASLLLLPGRIER